MIHISYSYIPIRGYGITWRNSYDKVVKRVHYDNENFKPKFIEEDDVLAELPPNYIYNVTVINHVNKLMVSRKPIK
tara:strand:- start:1781 stop:2008 length:228 start_codon:yes stop_codon:yes gene_type:complete